MSFTDITGKVKTSHPAIPQIYAYTTPEIARHDGWTKIGYTEQDVNQRIRQQVHTANVEAHLEWHGNATWEDGSGTFRDTDFHSYLRKLGVENDPENEWFHIAPDPAHTHFYEFRENHGVLDTPLASEYRLRDEQERAVEQTLAYATAHEEGEFLWNAKPRFGKTLSSYDFCKRVGARTVLIVTNRPAIANSWYDDYVKFVGTEAGYCFISNVDALKGKPYCMNRDEYLSRDRSKLPAGFIEFVSLQDLKGSIRFGGVFDKLSEVADLTWDVLIVDEAHEGVDTLKTDVAFDHIQRRFTLHLSGTPFKAIANEKFPEDAIFNWTYADEQQAKRDWPEDSELPNPYADLPQLNMFTYQMSEVALDEAQRGIDIDGETVEYAFDLNEFFAIDQRGSFVHDAEVNRFLDALTAQKKFPFSTPELRDELRHTFWMLNHVDSAKALARKLQRHPVFKDYEVVVAAGDGKLDDADETQKAFDKVRAAIANNDKTITLSVGQLTTGVTIPEWTAVLMLSNMKSPALYMQAAFRAQNPCLFNRNGKFLRKENAYVFDFDPARTLTIFEEFANDLYTDTASGGGTVEERKQRIRRLLNFFPVIGEDENGEMTALDAERVLSIPRKIRSREVVRRGFMSDFLFQNIGSVFRAPAEVLEVIQRLEPCKAPKEDLGIDDGTADDLSLNDDGEVELPEEQVVGTAAGLFGNKVYGDVANDLDDVIESITLEPSEESDDDRLINQLSDAFATQVTAPLVEAARQNYGDDLKPARQKRVERKIKADVDIAINHEVGSFKIQRNMIENERARALEEAASDEEEHQINAEHDAKVAEARNDLVNSLKSARDDMVHGAGETIVREVETAKREEKKQNIESGIRDHLRGFSRTVPSFLMAYGDEETTLGKFDSVVPEQVFYEVTSITADEFRMLRDGGDVRDPETGDMVHFDGHVFDPVVFDDSVREFIDLRTKLANYFDDSQKEDIFDYVPPQKTNQIFTPKRVVRDMVDMFEQENPGCFDDPDHTFADLYMKSGLYITEIVKRLFNSEAMRKSIPDNDERMRHILERQVFGVAPSEIIYQIVTHYILGYHDEIGKGCGHNFRCADTAELAKEGKLAKWVDREFGGKLGSGTQSETHMTTVESRTNCEVTIVSSLGESSAGNSECGDWILSIVEEAGLEYADKRKSGGNLWVVGDKSIQATIDELEKRGARFTYKAGGGKATGHRPAWYIPASAAERALRKRS